MIEVDSLEVAQLLARIDAEQQQERSQDDERAA
jgi:hypothetical protein